MFRGQPRGLAPLFFTEMWERLGFYLMVGILMLYAKDAERGGLGLAEGEANAIYGTYLAFVYFTPFLGGIIADRFLGFRRAVLIGGLFFVLGFFMLGLRGMGFFYGGLTCLCIGNGFFKPNISAMVGNLYAPGDKLRDAGFNLFYMGINIGAAAANLAAAPIRNQISWRWTFWAAAIGLCIGIVILLANWKLLEKADKPSGRSGEQTTLTDVLVKILLPAAVFGVLGYVAGVTFDTKENFHVEASMCGFLLGMVPIFGYFVRLSKTAPEAERPGLSALLPIYLAGGTFFMILHLNGSAFTSWAEKKTDRHVEVMPDFWKQDALLSYYTNANPDVPRPDPRMFAVVDDVTAKLFGTKRFTEATLAKAALPPDVQPVETWNPAAGKLVDDGLLDRYASFVFDDSDVAVSTTAEGGKTAVDVVLADGAHPLRKVAFARDLDGVRAPVLLVTQSTLDGAYGGSEVATSTLPPREFLRVVSPEIYQSWNPIFVVLLTPLVVPFFFMLSRRGREVSTARKLFYGLILTALAMAVMFVAGVLTDNGQVKVSGIWLAVSYFMLTVGELCLSPMGLSLVTKLSPKRLVGMMMGGWFCATAFGNKLSGFLGGIESSMTPSNFFLLLVFAPLLVAVYIRIQLPRLESTLKQYGA